MSDNFEALLQESRIFEPPAEFKEKAKVADLSLYEWAERDFLGFWADAAKDIEWFLPFEKVLDDSDAPFYRWYTGGKLNVSYNCVDRHTKSFRRNKAALIFEGEPGDSKILTYQELYREVNKFANVLKKLGVQKGDRVTIYMPMIPEAVIAMLACTRIGAPHSVVFGGFSSQALKDRIDDAKAKLLITADGGYRRGSIVELKKNADAALEGETTIEKVVVVKRTGQEVPMTEGRDYWYHELMADAALYCEPEQCDAEDMLFILYSSGTTGKPKGIQHTTGGYLVGVHTTFKYIFDYREEDIYWCTADIGWITGHSYIVYGPLSNGATVVLYEGAPDWPQKDRFWEIIEKYRVNILYTAPTAIRTFMRWGEKWPKGRDLSSLRLLGTVGEPINPEAWIWYHEHIGGGRCPIVDTWWQTETGMIMITPLPGVIPTKPGSATKPFPGVEADVVNDKGEPVPPGQGGYLVLKKPWPAMLRTLYGDPERYKNTYWSKFPGWYFTGDGAKKDEDGYFWILGRVDDVINVSGHRIGTMEVESALVEHPLVAEAAVIGKSHEVKGQAIAAFVTLKEGVEGTPELVQELKQFVAQKIGALARPDDIFFTAELPKTRSGKIMRRLLRDIAEGRALGDTTTLTDPAVINKIKEQYKDEG
ncbi:acetate--CoA ligase [Carboxydothermus hydrogenoformans]|uniref:Acetyl-coenzyme A synthetase n=1 Tax=Carboxydothermus hydrogenoformans (strain ATCC BAA-161 / DSM 6008 / Z-2901) TaxID=246194 RepID=Q3AEC0_CARHZ|nr:acetate--CoA ligase [Carboxydothermus hydrogenoformans]ABB15628.1 acetyl-CoA synthetase [Carboxydothermus hydrogenoformans Z-2901]